MSEQTTTQISTAGQNKKIAHEQLTPQEKLQQYILESVDTRRVLPWFISLAVIAMLGTLYTLLLGFGLVPNIFHSAQDPLWVKWTVTVLFLFVSMVMDILVIQIIRQKKKSDRIVRKMLKDSAELRTYTLTLLEADPWLKAFVSSRLGWILQT